MCCGVSNGVQSGEVLLTAAGAVLIEHSGIEGVQMVVVQVCANVAAGNAFIFNGYNNYLLWVLSLYSGSKNN